jgi:hypothetical protein
LASAKAAKRTRRVGTVSSSISRIVAARCPVGHLGRQSGAVRNYLTAAAINCKRLGRCSTFLLREALALSHNKADREIRPVRCPLARRPLGRTPQRSGVVATPFQSSPHCARLLNDANHAAGRAR